MLIDFFKSDLFRMDPGSVISNESIDENIQKSSFNRVKKRKKQLYVDLRKQMEFYLSDANLRKDRYFGNLMQTANCKYVLLNNR